MTKNMASTLPSPTKVAGKHSPIYEAYYKQVDPKGAGTIEALVAAKFLKKSGLSDVVLSRIWDLSDPTGKGYLDKSGLFVALKLVALAQTGETINMSNVMNVELANPPKVGDIPKIVAPKIQSVPPSSDDWSIKPIDKLKYEELFESLQPVDGLLPGNKVRSVLMDSKLPLDVLSKIWDLADQDRDGSLDKHEFIVAMHLVYLALDKRAIPQVLPAELQRSARKTSVQSDHFVANFDVANIGPPPVPPLPTVKSNLPPAIPPMPQISNRQNTVPSLLDTSAPSDWVVTPADRIRSDAIFAQSDLDKDGLVSGSEIKGVFMQSGIPQMCLAQIWALCDTNQSGKLTSEQFALAIWLVERKKNGIEPPNVLAPNMIPQSLRTNNTTAGIGNLIGEPLMPVTQIAPVQPTEPQRQVYTNPELEMISKEIEELAKERRLLESDLVQKEADIRIKNGEVRNLQSELDTLVATLKQLENQKGEAQKRLNDLKAQSDFIDERFITVNNNIDDTRDKVTKIREQCQKQEETIREQETELDSKRGELQKLKDEESSLEKEYEDNKRKLEKLSKSLQDTQLQICQIKALVTQLEENQRQMNDALAVCKTAIDANDPSQASYFSLKIEPDFREAKKALETKPETPNDSFDDKANGFSNGTENGFAKNKFTTNFDESAGFGGGFDDGFGNNFPSKPNDPFAANSNAQDPFGDKKSSNVHTSDPNKDDFGSDPFAILHAPTTATQATSPGSNLDARSHPPPRPESPSPALPPKKAKQPPPRPAPPRPMQGPTIAKQESGFGNSGSGFANFADFDNKSSGLTDFAEDPFKDYRYEDPFNIEDPFDDTQDSKKDEHNNALLSKPSSTRNLISYSQSGKITLTNNKFEKEKEKGGDVMSFGFIKETSNGAGSNNNEINDNFANFDAFLPNNCDPFKNCEFTDSIGFNNNQISAPHTISKIINTKSTTDTTDGLLTSLSFTPNSPSKRSTLTNEIKQNNKNQNNNGSFETNFASFVTNHSSKEKADTFNAKTKSNQILQQQFTSDGAEGFADFSTINAFEIENNSSLQFESTFQPSGVLDANSNKKSDCDTTINDADKIPSKFLNDYSKNDEFDTDLPEALKRSLVYQ